MRAIRYGQQLAIGDAGVLSRRLYAFGAIPRGSRWDDLLDGPNDVLGLLGLAPGGHSRRVLHGDYQAVTHPSWLSWSRVPENGEVQPRLPYKLYFSPRPEALAEGFRAAVGVLSEQGVLSFKLGRGVLGLLRADKLIAYLTDAGQLARVAAALASAVDGCPAQGVPFTAEASPGGLLSWGMDPPPPPRSPVPAAAQSWRLWVTNRLASALVQARSAAPIAGMDPCAFAIERLTLEGVDTSRWRPAGATRRAWERA